MHYLHVPNQAPRQDRLPNHAPKCVTCRPISRSPDVQLQSRAWSLLKLICCLKMPLNLKLIPYSTEPKDLLIWFQHENELRRLYLEEKKPLREVKSIMETNHEFPLLRSEIIQDSPRPIFFSFIRVSLTN